MAVKNEPVKQVIVMRAKFPDKDGELKKLRTGKYIAQGAHASMAFLTSKFRSLLEPDRDNPRDEITGYCIPTFQRVPFSFEQFKWIADRFTKVVLYVDTEEELLEIYDKAKDAKLTAHLITDAGATEFNGVPTKTCLAIGPHYASKIDAITGHLKLF